MHEHQIYLWSGRREQLIRRHDFYLDQACKRLLSQFDDLENEATLHGEDYYQRLSAAVSIDHDPDLIHEQARDEVFQHYDLLIEMKRQTILNILAGCYHQWETDLRALLEKELIRTLSDNFTQKNTWENNIIQIYDVLAAFGWNIRDCGFFDRIDTMRLIVNVHKHGKGNSLNNLIKKHPNFIQPTYDFITPNLGASNSKQVTLMVSMKEFKDLAGGCRAFWEQMPEHNFYQSETDSASG